MTVQSKRIRCVGKLFVRGRIEHSLSDVSKNHPLDFVINFNVCYFCRFVSFWIEGLDFMDNSGVRVDYENALVNAGFGKFHYFLLAVCGMIYTNTAIGITIISFVLPSAACDLKMSSSDKGLLTAAPMMGKFTHSICTNPIPIHSISTHFVASIRYAYWQVS